MIMGDGILGQMMEAVEFKDVENIEKIDKPWATTGTQMKREHNTITSIYIQPEVLEKHNQKLQAKYRLIEEGKPVLKVTIVKMRIL